jgi:hypothetical protein
MTKQGFCVLEEVQILHAWLALQDSCLSVLSACGCWRSGVDVEVASFYMLVG